MHGQITWPKVSSDLLTPRTYLPNGVTRIERAYGASRATNLVLQSCTLPSQALDPESKKKKKNTTQLFSAQPMPPSTPYKSYAGARSTPYDADGASSRFLNESVADVAGSSSLRTDPASRGRRPFQSSGLFHKDLRLLMYAYGDVANPAPESVAILEEMTVDFLTDLCLRAEPSIYALGLSSSQFAATATDANGDSPASSALRGQPSAMQTYRQRAKLDDFKHALRNDRKKLGRLEQLLYADKMVQEARRIGGVEDVAASAGALLHGEGRQPS